METIPDKLMVIAGEASGDLHGGYIIQDLIKLNPSIQLIGTGGAKLAANGVKLYYNVKDLAVIGFWEVLKRYGYFKQVFNDIVAKLDEEKPGAVLLIDYPGFNLRLAAEAKKRGIKVIFYVAPQVWAWKKNRIKQIKQYIDELIVLFPFEVDYFKKEGMNTRFFGNPLLDVAQVTQNKTEVFKKYQLDEDKTTICLLPGSRENEISKHLSLLIETAEIINHQKENVQFVIPLASTVNQSDIERQLAGFDITLIQGDTYNIVGHSDFAVVASGIATLETAVLETPMVIYYKISAGTYFLGKHILKIETIGLPNIISGKKIVPELVNNFATAGGISDVILEYLDSKDKYQIIKKDLIELKKQLGTTGAYQKTAEFINQYLSNL
ncbi:MAG: lipid-A-disaccharide synthase [Deltaproteobacteria bacterium]|jgi:lipid-A-disaccharide synthase|nr:lipid-A-disaccharide synthase [Deltaproteobacteria bacterium]MBT4525085.1 lipid-A-disaccharide synthase [Deltaproteobacteria bacterium]